MFKDDFKKANDSIHADSALLDRVLSLKPEKRRFNPKYIPAAAAAVIVLSTTAVTLPKLINRDSSGIIYESSVQHDEPDYENELSDDILKNSEEKSPSVSSAPISSSPASMPDTSANTAGVSPAKQTASPKQTSAAVKPPAAAPEPPADNTAAPVTNETVTYVPEQSILPEQPVTAGESESKEDISMEIKPPIETKKSVVLSINYSDYEPEITDFEQITNDSGDIIKEYTAEEWDNGRYFEYLGFNLTELLKLPEDFCYVGNESITVMADKDGIPSFDNRIFPFEGENGRYITVITSKNTMTAQVYLSDEHYTLSSIYDIPAVIIGTEKGYRCYMICGGISYVITADGLNEKELENILVPLAAAQ